MKMQKIIYCRIHTDRTGTEQWMQAVNSLDELDVEIGEKVEVGIYKLSETIEAEGTIVTRVKSNAHAKTEKDHASRN
jgi:hypothetical protein